MSRNKLRLHFFVCTNARPPLAKPSCGPRGGNQILAMLKEEVERRQLKAEVRICASSCLGPCEDGPNIVVYPEGIWYQGVTPDDVPELVESHIVGNRPVERLRYHWPDEE